MRFVFLLLIVFSLEASGQAPQAINYQGILRNASGQAIPNKQVKIRVNVSTNSVVDNSSVYTEEIAAKTNEFGIYNVAIGKGKATKGTFNSISWGTNKYWVLIELDENLSNKFEFAGSMELASVPYALYAEKAKSLDNPIAGPAGPQGPQGMQGPQGLQGIKGDKGDAGAPGSAGVNGAAGTTGAQGPIGLTGPAGATGANGAQGPIGLTGPAGATSLQGTQGATGLQGLQGIKGDTGAQGPVGLTGAAGPAGANGTTGAQGLQGIKGDKGDIGATGPQGAAGTAGANGAQGPIGLTGATGIAGATGSAGVQGPQGLQGIKGDTGAQGPVGLTGTAGATGAQGLIGLTGPAGAAGSQGTQGVAGAQGPIGLTGPAGSNATITMGSISATSNVNGGTISSGVLNLSPADATNGGVLTNGTQSIKGVKTFVNDLKVNEITIGRGSGNISTNTAVGSGALSSTTTGSNNTAIGYSADVSSGTLSNSTAIGNGAIVNASNTIQLGNSAVTNIKTNGTITLGTLTYPNIDGIAGQVLSTTGSGTLTWTTGITGSGGGGLEMKSIKISGPNNWYFSGAWGPSNNRHIYYSYDVLFNRPFPSTNVVTLFRSNKNVSFSNLTTTGLTFTADFYGDVANVADALNNNSDIIVDALFVQTGEASGNNSSNTNITHTLGESYEGGIVFFVTPDGKHGLIAAEQDQSVVSWPRVGVNWYEAPNYVPNPSNHNGNGKKFTDWRLPSKYELNLLFINKVQIGNLTTDNYWSSTIANQYQAWWQNFGSGNQGFVDFISDNGRVRAVRSF